MKRPLLYSAALHLIILLLIFIGFYNPFEKTVITEQPLMIEFVQVAEQSAAPHLAPEIMQKAETAPARPAPSPSRPLREAEAEAKVEARIKDAWPAPSTPSSQVTSQPAPPPQKPAQTPAPPNAKPEDTIPVADSLPEVKAKPKPPPKPIEEKPKSQKAEINLDKKKQPTVKREEEIPDKKKKPLPAKASEVDKQKKAAKSFDDLASEIETLADETPATGKGSPASTLGALPTASEIDAIRHCIYKCWIIPAGMHGARDMVVDIDVDVARDGTVIKADIVNKKRMAADSLFRAAAESARRAVLDPRCNPLPIPADKYDQFKHFTFGFNSKDML